LRAGIVFLRRVEKKAATERLRGKFQDDCLNVNWFQNSWAKRRKEYNEERPHNPLGYQLPSSVRAAASSFFVWLHAPRTPDEATHLSKAANAV
jgi:hypothetical protein